MARPIPRVAPLTSVTRSTGGPESCSAIPLRSLQQCRRGDARCRYRDAPNDASSDTGPSLTSLRLDVCPPDDLTPLLGFVGDELSEFGGRARKSNSAEFGKLCLDAGLGKACVDLFIDPLDHVNRRVPGRAQAGPPARLITRQEFGHARDARQRLRARRRGHRERPQGAGSDVFDRRRYALERDLHVAADQVAERLWPASIRHMKHIDARHYLEQLAREML